MKYANLSVMLKLTDTGAESIALSEITAYLFGFVLYFNPTDTWKYHGIDITGFADVGYDDLATVEMPWKIEEMNDILPEHYRSKEEIQKCIEENRKWSEKHGDM